MYDKHVYVHTACFGWCTIPTKFDTKLSVILPKCDLELVLLDCWSFGEVVKIRRPNIPVTLPAPVIPMNAQQNKVTDIIPQNVLIISPCKVSIERLPAPKDTGASKGCTTPKVTSYEMRVRPPPKKLTHCTSGRKRVCVDYSQYNTDDPPPPRKRKRVDRKRRPSAGRIAAEKYKTKPCNLPQPVRSKASTISSTTDTTQQTPVTPARDPAGKVTIMKPATEKETDEVINQLLNIDIPQDDKIADEYEVPLASIQVPVQPTEDASKDKKNEQTATPATKSPRRKRKCLKLWNINSKGNIQNQGTFPVSHV